MVERAEPALEEVGDPGRHLRPRTELTAVADAPDEAGELEGEERIAGGGLDDLGRGPASQRRMFVEAKHVAKGRGVEGPEPEVLHAVAGEGLPDAHAVRLSCSHDEPRRRRAKAPSGEVERAGRRLVEPLLVVDRDQDRRDVGERADQADQRGAHGAVVRWTLGSQANGIERGPLRLGEQIEGRHVIEQVRQAGVVEGGVRLEARDRQDEVAAVFRDAADRGQQRTLADAGLAGHENAAPLRRLDEARQAGQFAFPPGELACPGRRGPVATRTHGFIVSRSGPFGAAFPPLGRTARGSLVRLRIHLRHPRGTP